MSAAEHYLLAIAATTALGLLWVCAERLARSGGGHREDAPPGRCGHCGCASRMGSAGGIDQTHREEA